MAFWKSIYNRRPAEPNWFVGLRAIIAGLLTFFFVANIVLSVSYIIMGSIVVQQYESDLTEVAMPAMTICYDGDSKILAANQSEPINGTIQLNCSISYFKDPLSCNHWLKVDRITHCIHVRDPLPHNVFRSSDDMVSNFKLDVIYPPDINMTTQPEFHIQFFDRDYDPSVIDTSQQNLLEQEDADYYKNFSTFPSVFEIRNQVSIASGKLSRIDFHGAIYHRNLIDRSRWSAFWNYLGWMVRNTINVISVNSAFTKDSLTQLLVLRPVFTQTVTCAIRLHTVATTVAGIGGLYGALAGVFIYLFGAQPAAPWGVMHVFRPGTFKSMLDGTFRSSTGLPLADKTDWRLPSSSNLTGKSLDTVADRVQALEEFLKEYFVSAGYVQHSHETSGWRLVRRKVDGVFRLRGEPKVDKTRDWQPIRSKVEAEGVFRSKGDPEKAGALA